MTPEPASKKQRPDAFMNSKDSHKENRPVNKPIKTTNITSFDKVTERE